LKKLLALMIALTGIALVAPVLAQPIGSAGPAGPGTDPVKNRREMRNAARGMMILMQTYNPKTVTTVKGGVQTLGTFPPNNPTPGAAVSAVLKTEQGGITIYLVPNWYLEEQKIALKAGDELEVTGSKVSLGKGRHRTLLSGPSRWTARPSPSGMTEGCPYGWRAGPTSPRQSEPEWADFGLKLENRGPSPRLRLNVHFGDPVNGKGNISHPHFACCYDGCLFPVNPSIA